MIDLQLFLGYPVDELFAARLHEISPELKAHFVGLNPDYLEECRIGGNHFLGKKVGKEIDLDNLKQVEKNIYSLLDRLVPTYPFRDKSLILFSLNK